MCRINILISFFVFLNVNFLPIGIIFLTDFFRVYIPVIFEIICVFVGYSIGV